MSQTILRPKDGFTVPVEADSICPDRFVGLSQKEVGSLPVYYGRRQMTIADLFEIDGDGAEEIVVEGSESLSHVKRIGQGMRLGRIIVNGNVGMHLGAGMQAGKILVNGNVGAWAGAHMSGGLIRINGNAAAMLGSAYVGEARGMRGGVIIVNGNVGPRAGERLRRGMIVVDGAVGEFAGAKMIAGSIFVFGCLGARAGAGMKRGTIVALGGLADGVLPIFRPACSYSPSFLRLYLKRLSEWGLPVKPEHFANPVQRFTGDITTLGKGEILVYDQHQ